MNNGVGESVGVTPVTTNNDVGDYLIAAFSSSKQPNNVISWMNNDYGLSGTLLVDPGMIEGKVGPNATGRGVYADNIPYVVNNMTDNDTFRVGLHENMHKLISNYTNDLYPQIKNTEDWEQPNLQLWRLEYEGQRDNKDNAKERGKNIAELSAEILASKVAGNYAMTGDIPGWNATIENLSLGFSDRDRELARNIANSTYDRYKGDNPNWGQNYMKAFNYRSHVRKLNKIRKSVIF